MQGSVESDREASEDHEQASNGQVQKNVVERCAEFLVFHRDKEREEVDREGGDHEEKHVSGEQRILPRLGEVVLGLFERVPHQACLVGHRHVEVRTLCPVHDDCSNSGTQEGKQEQTKIANKQKKKILEL